MKCTYCPVEFFRGEPKEIPKGIPFRVIEWMNSYYTRSAKSYGSLFLRKTKYIRSVKMDSSWWNTSCGPFEPISILLYMRST